MTNAWIFTGGTDSGVMKLVAQAFSWYSPEAELGDISNSVTWREDTK